MTKQEFLAMSLPYGLKMCYTYENRIDIHTLLPMHFDCKCQLVNERGKPILRPLSDLKNTSGVGFNVMKEVFEMGNGEWIQLLNASAINIDKLPYKIINILIKNHFDIADLISKGEAINVNTLELNPYIE